MEADVPLVVCGEGRGEPFLPLEGLALHAFDLLFYLRQVAVNHIPAGLFPIFQQLLPQFIDSPVLEGDAIREEKTPRASSGRFPTTPAPK